MEPSSSMKRTAAPALLLLTALISCTTAGTETSPPEQPVDEISAPTTCIGTPGKPTGSDSYRTGASDTEQDGDDLVVTVTVRLQTATGTCVLAKNVLVEIWHTGDDGTYRDDAWRTALRTGADGTISYQTVRPIPEENFPHLHVRVTPRIGAPEDWVIGVTPDTPRELRIDLLVGTATSPTTSQVPASDTGV
jgi:protocatechuate 3,4-dioxygenase beta subunit